MSRKATPKSNRYGYELLLNVEGADGKETWRRVGTSDESDGLFSSSMQANDFRLKKYPKVKKYIIKSVRLPHAVLGLTPHSAGGRFQFMHEKRDDSKKGTHKK